MVFKPFTFHIELPRDVRRELHRAQIYLSLAEGNEDLLRVAIVPDEERFSLRVADGEVSLAGGPPELTWLPTSAPDVGGSDRGGP